MDDPLIDAQGVRRAPRKLLLGDEMKVTKGNKDLLTHPISDRLYLAHTRKPVVTIEKVVSTQVKTSSVGPFDSSGTFRVASTAEAILVDER